MTSFAAGEPGVLPASASPPPPSVPPEPVPELLLPELLPEELPEELLVVPPELEPPPAEDAESVLASFMADGPPEDEFDPHPRTASRTALKEPKARVELDRMAVLS
jgi:hypothetical protein